ncbi:hypothetical protein BD779DRAFT_1784606 [Infundibulicybe gibba]|nr:hypothetical protein BD779DRAFT_1784606 [Infundibulicybe gibba]
MAILLELLGNYPSTELRVDSADLQLMREGAGAWKMKGHLVMKCGGANWATFGAAAFLRVATNAILERVSQGQYHVSKGLGECGSFYVNIKECVRVNSEWARNVRNVSRNVAEERSMDLGISWRNATGHGTIWVNCGFFDVALWTTGPSAWGFEFLSVNPRGGLQNDMLRGLWPKPTTKPTHNTST